MSGGVRAGAAPSPARRWQGSSTPVRWCLRRGLIALCVDLPRYVRRHRELQSLLDGCLYAADSAARLRAGLWRRTGARSFCVLIDQQRRPGRRPRPRPAATVRPASPCGRIRSRCRMAAMRMLLQSEPEPRLGPADGGTVQGGAIRGNAARLPAPHRSLDRSVTCASAT